MQYFDDQKFRPAPDYPVPAFTLVWRTGRFPKPLRSARVPLGEFAHVTGYASKSAEQAARIAAVMTLWADLDAKEVSGATMADAVELAGYYLREAVRLSDAAIVSLEIDQAERLRVWLVERWNHAEILPSDVLQLAPITALRQRPTVNKAIKTLVEAGWLVALEDGSTVRGKVRKAAYRIVKG